MNGFLEPGMIVRHPDAAEWGEGQVQSRIGDRITVNFTEAGKRVIDGSRVTLELVSADTDQAAHGLCLKST
ncbi:MAG: DUF3553 domain-containing protein [Paracoccus sp. (in: a-proteobacteria)]|nr:DUF3553 domain-containing protein [Paracoccus sp. (in: a-proteobacteria)]